MSDNLEKDIYELLQNNEPYGLDKYDIANALSVTAHDVNSCLYYLQANVPNSVYTSECVTGTTRPIWHVVNPNIDYKCLFNNNDIIDDSDEDYITQEEQNDIDRIRAEISSVKLKANSLYDEIVNHKQNLTKSDKDVDFKFNMIDIIVKQYILEDTIDITGNLSSYETYLGKIISLYDNIKAFDMLLRKLLTTNVADLKASANSKILELYDLINSKVNSSCNIDSPELSKTQRMLTKIENKIIKISVSDDLSYSKIDRYTNIINKELLLINAITIDLNNIKETRSDKLIQAKTEIKQSDTAPKCDKPNGLVQPSDNANKVIIKHLKNESEQGNDTSPTFIQTDNNICSTLNRELDLTKKEILTSSQYTIKSKSTGETYNKLFGDKLINARKVVLIETYLNTNSQIDDVDEFLQTVHENVGHNGIVKVHLITLPFDSDKSHDIYTNGERESRFIEIQTKFKKINIYFSWESDTHVHGRFLIIDNGWQVNMDIGLHIYISRDWNRAKPQFDRTTIDKPVNITYLPCSEQMSEYFNRVPKDIN